MDKMLIGMARRQVGAGTSILNSRPRWTWFLPWNLRLYLYLARHVIPEARRFLQVVEGLQAGKIFQRGDRNARVYSNAGNEKGSQLPDDAEREVMPVMLKDIVWPSVKEYFPAKQKRLLNRIKA